MTAFHVVLEPDSWKKEGLGDLLEQKCTKQNI